MPHARAFEGDTGRQSSSATEQRDTPSRAAGIRWRELYINAAGLTGRKREGERLPNQSEARSADRSLGNGQTARTHIVEGDILCATNSNFHTPEIHAAWSSAQLARGGRQVLTNKARAAGHRDQTKQRTDPFPCARVSAQGTLFS